MYLMNTIANHLKTIYLKSQTLTIQAVGSSDNKKRDVLISRRICAITASSKSTNTVWAIKIVEQCTVESNAEALWVYDCQKLLKFQHLKFVLEFSKKKVFCLTKENKFFA